MAYNLSNKEPRSNCGSTSGICHLVIHQFTTLRQNLGRHKCKDEGKVEAFMTQWLATFLSAENKMLFLR